MKEKDCCVLNARRIVNTETNTEADVLRVKEIMLYRKMGISIETIYLLINKQVNQKDVFIETAKDTSG